MPNLRTSTDTERRPPRLRSDAVADDIPSTDQLTVTIDPGPTTTIVLAGDLDPATAPQLEAAVTAAAAADGVDQVVLDLGGLSFVDSSGLRVFVLAREDLTSRGRGLQLRNPSPNTRRLLDITGLGEIIAVD